MVPARNITSSYTDACDVRVEVIENGKVVTSHEYTAKNWVEANRAYGRLLIRGFHARMVSTGLLPHVISEGFNVLDDEGRHVRPCPACGPVCMVSHHRGDVTGSRIIADHYGDDHRQCHPDGCHEPDVDSPRQVRTRERS